MKYLAILFLTSFLFGQFYIESEIATNMIIRANGDSVCVEIGETEWVGQKDILLMNYPCEKKICVRQDWKMIIAWSVFWTGITYIICNHQRGRK